MLAKIILIFASVAHAYTIQGNLNVTSTAAIDGSVFSVGGSSFSVTGGSATVAYSMTAESFVGNGTNLTGINSSAGWRINGNNIDLQSSACSVTTESTMTVQGNAFSVGGSSFTVSGGSATVAYSLTAGAFLGNATSASTATILGAGATALSSVTFQNGTFSVATSTLSIINGRVGIGIVTPCSTCTLHVGGTLAVTGASEFGQALIVDSTTNISNVVSSNTATTNSIYNSSFTVCDATATVTLHGSPVQLDFQSQTLQSANALNKGCGLYILENGSYIFYENHTTPLVYHNTIQLNDQVSFQVFLTPTPAAGTYNFCYGAAGPGNINGYCSFSNPIFSVSEVR